VAVFYLRSTAVKVALLCVALCQWASAAELKIVGPATVPVGGMVMYRLEGAKLGEPFDFFATPTNVPLVVLFDVSGVPVGMLNGEKAGALTLVAVSYDAETKAIVRDLKTVVVGNVPPQPIPPDPTPVPPDPTPIPPQPAGFRVLILEETAERGKLPASQVTALTSTQARAYMNAKTPKGPDGKTPEWRMLDDDHVDVSFLAENWKKALELARKDSAGKLPWIVVSNGSAGESRPFPATEAELLELLRKYGG
jgi:hypothetical protein